MLVATRVTGVTLGNILEASFPVLMNLVDNGKEQKSVEEEYGGSQYNFQIQYEIALKFEEYSGGSNEEEYSNDGPFPQLDTYLPFIIEFVTPLVHMVSKVKSVILTLTLGARILVQH